MKGLRDVPWRDRGNRGKVAVGLVVALILFALIAVVGCGDETAPTTTTVVEIAEVAAVPTTASPTTTSSTTTTEAPTTTTEPLLAVELVRVVDGDTIVVTLPDGSEETVRYIGMDTPETKDPNSPVMYMGPEATAKNEELLQSGPLTMKLDVEERDKYGRLLAYVYAGDVFVNLELVKSGYAQVSTYPPNVEFVDALTGAQEEARTHEVGLWAPTTTTEAEVETTPPPTEAPSGGGEVYVTKTGEKYHRDVCQYLAKSKIPISLADAMARGYTACSKCF
jgi:micrococcal nuclease